RALPSGLTVTNNQDDGSPGSLRATIAAASPGDTIQFDSSLAFQTILLDTARGTLQLDKDLTITAESVGAVTIDGNQGGFSVLTVDPSATVVLFALSISHAFNFHSHGGGISNAGTLTLILSTVAHNGVGGFNGGGIFNTGTLTLTKSTVSGNGATREVFGGNGGGIWNGGTMMVTDSTVSDNTCHQDFTDPQRLRGLGGGIWNEGTLTVTRST